MKGYVDELLIWYGESGTAKDPAGESLFDEKVGARRGTFFSTVAKLLYLAKRARPEELTGVLDLATRVQKCDEEDVRKLERVMNYLRATSEKGVVLRSQTTKGGNAS